MIRRLPYRAALVVAALLASCAEQPDEAGFTMKQRDEIRDIAREATIDDRDRLDRIEKKLDINYGD